MGISTPVLAAPVPAPANLAELPEPVAWQPGKPDPAQFDVDADGVPNDDDSCPLLPNPIENGRQRDVCSREFTKQANADVFLKSRVLRAPEGLDPILAASKDKGRLHVILHLVQDRSGRLFSSTTRAQLAALGVRLLGYVPNRAYYASLPAVSLAAVAALDGVSGVSARLPGDKLDRAVRVRGPADTAADGSFELEVEFFEDLGPAEVEAQLAEFGAPFSHLYDQSYAVELESWQRLRELLEVDGVKWVDEPDDELDEYTLNAQAAIGASSVSDNYGYTGQGMTIAMFELGALTLNPENPDMQGRVTIGNTPEFPYDETDHAWKVASILIADGTSTPENQGLLPEAHLVSYAAGLQTRKRRFYGIPAEARDEYGAFLFNNSWGKYKCSKIGEYTKHAKFRDRAIVDHGIVMVDGAGNGRDPEVGYPAEGCTPDQYSLGIYNAKNSIMVGAWSPSQKALLSGSSKGPTADGRLKPDVVAPGDRVDTLGFVTTELTDVSGEPVGGLQAPEFAGESYPVQFSGTSAATPVTSGVVGWMGQAFEDAGFALETVRPATIKAILLHTARDVGLPGPDFDHGYGLIQAGAAVRMALEWSQWGREHTFTRENEEFTFEFDIDSTTYAYKATLAWDDAEGEHTSDKALMNDLDLVLVSPSGETYYPFDLRFPNGTGFTPAEPCDETQAICDDTNNVEQVIARNDGSPLETGRWEAIVRARRLVSDEQSVSLVLTPPCPVIIDQDVTLDDPIDCEPHPADPVAIEVVADGVTLDCNDESVSGAAGAADSTKNFVGIAIQADDVTVENCALDDFDVGVRVGDETAPVSNAHVAHNTLANINRRGIDTWGDDHVLSFNTIEEMDRGAKSGIRLNAGIGSQASTNQLLGGAAGAVGVVVGPGSSQAVVTANYLTGDWTPGIRVESADELRPILDSFVMLNDVFEVPGNGIEVRGNVLSSDVDGNRVHAFGGSSAAIRVESLAGLRPNTNRVVFNVVLGAEGGGSATQTGIAIYDTEWTWTQQNLIEGVSVGVSDLGSDVSWIKSNAFLSLEPEYHGSVAILREGGAMTQIDGNYIEDQLSGISVVNAPGEVKVRNNAPVTVDSLGISVINSGATEITGNGVSAAVAGIGLYSTAGASISGNTVTGYRSRGIVAWRADDLEISGNDLEELDLVFPEIGHGVGIQYAEGDTAQIDFNEVTSEPNGTGILLGSNPTAPCTEIDVDNVTVSDNTLVGSATPFVAGCDVGNYDYTP